MTSVGNLAYFEQKQAAADTGPMKGYGKTIQYHAQQNRIVLIDQAKVTQPRRQLHRRRKNHL